MMEAVSTSETLVNFYETMGSSNPQDSHLQVADGADGELHGCHLLSVTPMMTFTTRDWKQKFTTV
jgi:hypothetical protein